MTKPIKLVDFQKYTKRFRACFCFQNVLSNLGLCQHGGTEHLFSPFLPQPLPLPPTKVSHFLVLQEFGLIFGDLMGPLNLS